MLFLSVAPTEITSIPDAGEPPEKYSGPELPAEDTVITPFSVADASASVIGSLAIG